ncbi:hypothetical protein D3C76_1646490 [compost metagenome]
MEPITIPSTLTDRRATGRPKWRVLANTIVESAAVAAIESMNRLPLKVMNAMPTAAIPIAETEYIMALRLAGVRKLSTEK